MTEERQIGVVQVEYGKDSGFTLLGGVLQVVDGQPKITVNPRLPATVLSVGVGYLLEHLTELRANGAILWFPGDELQQQREVGRD